MFFISHPFGSLVQTARPGSTTSIVQAKFELDRSILMTEPFSKLFQTESCLDLLKFLYFTTQLQNFSKAAEIVGGSAASVTIVWLH